jgi:hypothetical protein
MAVVLGQKLPTTFPNSLGRTEDFSSDFRGIGDAITFQFDSPLIAFGIDINTFLTLNGGFTATTGTGEVAASVFDPFPIAGSTGQFTGQFLGLSTTVPFQTVTISASTSLPFDLDTLRAVSAVSATPEPASLCLLGTGIVSTLVARRRHKR